MRIREVKVYYYCDFCCLHRLSRKGMEFHEKHCTKNPDRFCRLCFDYDAQPDYRALVGKIKALTPEPYFDYEARQRAWELLKSETNECPGCMMTVLRLGDLHSIRPDEIDEHWDWEDECRKRREQQMEDRRSQ
jgi:hypothetical protein